MTDPTFLHDARQTAQDAAGDVAQSIVDAADVQDIFTRANVPYLRIEPSADGVRVVTITDYSEDHPKRLYREMRDGARFTVQHGTNASGESAWLLTRRK